MGFLLDFDSKNNILRVTLEGGVTDAIVLECYAAIAKRVALRPCRVILSFSGATEFQVSSVTVRHLAEVAPAVPAGYMRVCVCPQDFIYGMARMFQMLGEATRPDLRVVRTMDEAYSVLGVKSPEFVLVTKAELGADSL